MVYRKQLCILRRLLIFSKRMKVHSQVWIRC